MTGTPRLGLPLLMPSQAQKHVTVNEGLLRLDALSQLTLASRSLASPPVDAPEGTAYAIPAGAEGTWEGQEGTLAIRVNGGWDFVAPATGWRAFTDDEAVEVTFRGGVWTAAADVGAGLKTVTTDHVPAAGSNSTTEPVILAGAIVFGVTGRIVEAVPGTATALRLGVPESDNRYGSGIGLAAGSWLRGLTGSPLAYWSDTPLLLTAEGGAFAGGGLVRLALHYVELPLPD